MPETNDQPVEQPAPEASPESRGQAPIVAAAKKIQAKTAEMATGITESASSFDERLKSLLRTEDPGDADEKNILKTPFYMAGDALDGTALLPARQALEIAETIAPAIPAAIRTIKDPIFHLPTTFQHPIQYLKNSARILTSGLKFVQTAINAIPRRLQEFTNRAIKRPSQRLGAKIPLIGKVISTVGNGIGWIGNKIRSGVEWLTKPLSIPDDAIADVS